ncbi:PH domain-containing protein [Flaviaesturariibacter amylovorans]|uniref:YdbS-like PH domain-containing protein n=1 Tax=Flaviaesturariibacter amylovorans TaxID=1084520 RepID=A0ABP8HJU6_9BACT
MPFSNLAIDPSELPQTADLELQPLAPAYRRLLRLQWRLTALFGFGLAALLFYWVPEWRGTAAYGATGGGLALLLVFYYLTIELGWPWAGYAVREHDVAFRAGWLFRRLQVCPVVRIQNCSLSRGPLDRQYGLATLRLYTAGADGADIRIPGLPLNEAERLQQHLLQRIHGTDSSAHRLD